LLYSLKVQVGTMNFDELRITRAASIYVMRQYVRNYPKAHKASMITRSQAKKRLKHTTNSIVKLYIKQMLWILLRKCFLEGRSLLGHDGETLAVVEAVVAVICRGQVAR
jgi:hypothetical protein